MTRIKVLKTSETSKGVEAKVKIKNKPNLIPEAVRRSRARVRALAATGFAFGDGPETEDLMTRLTEITNVERVDDEMGATIYTVLVDTPF